MGGNEPATFADWLVEVRAGKHGPVKTDEEMTVEDWDQLDKSLQWGIAYLRTYRKPWYWRLRPVWWFSVDHSALAKRFNLWVWRCKREGRKQWTRLSDWFFLHS